MYSIYFIQVKIINNYSEQKCGRKQIFIHSNNLICDALIRYLLKNYSDNRSAIRSFTLSVKTDYRATFRNEITRNLDNSRQLGVRIHYDMFRSSLVKFYDRSRPSDNRRGQSDRVNQIKAPGFSEGSNARRNQRANRSAVHAITRYRHYDASYFPPF